MNQKTKVTLLSQTLKVEENKVIFGPGAEILAIFSSDDSSNLTLLASNKEMVISRLLGLKSKN